MQNIFKRISGVLFILMLSVTLIFAAGTGIKTHTFSRDGKFLAAANSNGEINIWEFPAGKQTQSFNLKTKQINYIEFSPDGKTLFAADGTNDKFIFLDVASGKETKRLAWDNLSGIVNPTDIAFSPDGQTLWVFYQNTYDQPNEAILIDLKNNKLIENAPRLGYSWTTNAAKTIVAFYTPESKKISLVSIKDGKLTRTFPVDPVFISENGNSINMALSDDGSKLFLYRKIAEKDEKTFDTKRTHEIAIISAIDGKQLNRQRAEVLTGDALSLESEPVFRLSADGSKILLLDSSEVQDYKRKILTIIDAATLRKTKDVLYPSEKIDFYDASPDGRYFFTADETRKIKLYSSDTEKQTAVLSNTNAFFTTVVSNPDETKYAGIAANGTVKIWSADGKELKNIQTGLPGGKFLAFSADGRKLVTVHSLEIEEDSESREVTVFKLWDAETGALIRDFDNYNVSNSSPASFVTFSRKGDKIITDCEGGDNEIRRLCFWNAANGEFSSQDFPAFQKDSIVLGWLPDGQSPPVKSRYSASDFSQIPERATDTQYVLWNLATGKMMANVTDESELLAKLPKEANGTLFILPNGYFETKTAKIVPLSAESVFQMPIKDNFDYFSSSKLDFGAQLINVPLTENSVQESSASTFSTSKEQKVYPAAPDELKNGVEIMDMEKRDTVSTLRGHADDVMDVYFTPKNKRVITTSYDRTVRVWNLLTGEQLFILK